MKIMRIMRILITLLIIVVCTLSCKDEFLVVAPTGSITDAQLTSKNGLEGSLIGVYGMLSGRAIDFYTGSSNWFWGGVMGGDANKGTNSGDQAQMNEVQSYSPQTTNNSIFNKYRATYEGVARANALLRLLPEAQPDVSADDKLRIEAEAKFLRGHYYFELKKVFNNTPYIDETVDYAAGINEVGNGSDLWPMIEADLQFAFTNLPETQDQPGRANKWAAGALLARAKLFQGKFGEAKAIFDDVIANGKTASGLDYALIPHFGANFRISGDNNAESVFAIQAAAGTGTINNANPDFVLNFPYTGGPAGCCGFNQPSFDLVNAFRTDGNGLPLLDGSANTGANQVKTDQGVPATDAFTPDAGNLDPRLDHAVGRRGLPYLDHGPHPGISWIRDQNYGGPFTPKKYIWTKAEEASGGVDKSSWTPGYTAINVALIRFADVLLMAAECEVEAGSLEQARTYVNMIRERAADPTGFVMDGGTPAANYVIDTYNTAWTDQDFARTAVRFERRLELSDEGHRFFDLVRWGIAATVLNDYLDYERAQVAASPFVGASFTAGKNEYMPIPQREIDILTSDVLKQNPGY
jgi:hypothetical protein